MLPDGRATTCHVISILVDNYIEISSKEKSMLFTINLENRTLVIIFKSTVFHHDLTSTNSISSTLQIFFSPNPSSGINLKNEVSWKAYNFIQIPNSRACWLSNPLPIVCMQILDIPLCNGSWSIASTKPSTGVVCFIPVTEELLKHGRFCSLNDANNLKILFVK